MSRTLVLLILCDISFNFALAKLRHIRYNSYYKLIVTTGSKIRMV